MTRLIDADALSEKLCKTTIFIKGGEIFQRMINDAPTIEPDGDTISRRALMKRISEEYYEYGDDYDALQILGDIEDFPSAETPTVSEKHQLSVETPTNTPTDLISRQDAIEAVTDIQDGSGQRYYLAVSLVDKIRSLPSAEAIDLNESCEKCEHRLKGANEVPCCYCTIGKSFYTPTEATCATCADRAMCIMSAPDGKWKACKDYKPSAEAVQGCDGCI